MPTSKTKKPMETASLQEVVIRLPLPELREKVSLLRRTDLLLR